MSFVTCVVCYTSELKQCSFLLLNLANLYTLNYNNLKYIKEVKMCF